MAEQKTDLNKFSQRLTQPPSQAASQAMLYGAGLDEVDMNNPQVGIASMWWEGNSCNFHLNDLAKLVKQSINEGKKMVGLIFNTIGVSDGISMGTEGMKYSLQSREIIADSIETVVSAQWYDALVTLPGCDKNMPGSLIAMARLNRPSLMVYGGTISPGFLNGEKLDVVSTFQAYGELFSGKIDESRFENIIRHACPGGGACGGMYTANTMSSSIETLGMSLPYSSSISGLEIIRRPSTGSRKHSRQARRPSLSSKRSSFGPAARRPPLPGPPPPHELPRALKSPRSTPERNPS